MELAMEFKKKKRIDNPAVIQEVRSEICEYCGGRAYGEPYHIRTRRARGPEKRENLIQLCRQCHINAQEYKIKPAELIGIVARRECVTVEQIYEVIGWAAPDIAQEPKHVKTSFEDLIQAFITLEEQEIDCQWEKARLLISILDAGVKTKWLSSQIGKSPAHIREMAKAYRTFPEESMRNPQLSFYHHRLAANTETPTEWIDRANDEEMSTRELRKATIDDDIKKGKIPPSDEKEEQMKKAQNVFKNVEEVLKYGGDAANWLNSKLNELIS